MEVTGDDGKVQKIRFEQCIIAAGSEPIKLPFIPDDPRVIDSTGALELGGVPKRLLVIGGGIIGLEMATVYASLGAKLSVVELTGQLMPGADPDLVRPLEKRLKGRDEQILLNTKVTGCTAKPEGLAVDFEDANGKRTDVFDRVLVAVGRSANGKRIVLENADIDVATAVHPVDKQMRTNLPHVFASAISCQVPCSPTRPCTKKGRGGSGRGPEESFRCARDSFRGLPDPEVAWVGPHGDRGRKNGVQVQERQIPGGQRPFAGVGPRRRLLQILFARQSPRAGWWHGGS